MMIGSAMGARKALAGDLTYLGEGCFRSAYLDGDIVYKVHNEEGDEVAANLSEIENYARFKAGILKLPKDFRIVPMRLISVDNEPVIAARYIDGQRMGDCYCRPGDSLGYHATECLSEDISVALCNVDLDGSWGNIIFDGSTYWIVDAQ